MTTPDANSSVTVNVNTLSNALAVAIQQASSASATVAGNQQHHGSGGATRPVYLQVQVWLAEQPPVTNAVCFRWVRVDVGVF